MNTITYELREVGQSWHLLCNGELACVSLDRQFAIDTVARMHRHELRREEYAHLNLQGITLEELRCSRALDLNWKRKGRHILLEPFQQAQEFLARYDSELVLPEIYARYEEAMDNERFKDALDQLIILGEQLRCPSQYWHILQTIVAMVFDGAHHNPNRKVRGQAETIFQFVDRRAQGDWQWRPKIEIEGW